MGKGAPPVAQQLHPRQRQGQGGGGAPETTVGEGIIHPTLKHPVHPHHHSKPNQIQIGRRHPTTEPRAAACRAERV
eukprot:gene11706-biopygen12430